jgi:hypothetical protein
VAANDAGSGRTARAALVLMSRDPAVRERVGPELERRYGADYEVVVCLGRDDITSRVEELRARGLPVAVVLACLSPEDPDGLDVLAHIGALEPAAVRACIVRWGDLQTAAPIFEAITLGRLDAWLYRPAKAVDEAFHVSMTELLEEWESRQGDVYEAVRVIGERWSPRSQELRDMFTRNRVPVGFYDASAPAGREQLDSLGLEHPDLPVVVLRFQPEHPVLENPARCRSRPPSGSWNRWTAPRSSTSS